jgi:ATP-dependent DNA ligase
VVNRRDSKYEPGLRSGASQKMQVNPGQDFVIAGYTASPRKFDAVVIGYYGQQVDVCCTHSERIYASIAGGIVEEDQATRN